MAGFQPARSRMEATPRGVGIRRRAIPQPPGYPDYPDDMFVLPKKPIDRRQVTAALQDMIALPITRTSSPIRAHEPKAAPMSPAGPPRTRGSWDSIMAVVNGAQDSLPFEIGNYIPAAINAVAYGDVLNDPIGAFDNGLDTMRAMDHEDEVYHPRLRTTGKVLGTGAQVATFGPGLLGAARTARLVKAAHLIPREILALGGVGATGGGAVQLGSDAIFRRKLSSVPDLAGAVVGGAASAYSALAGNPGIIGATAGGVTSAAQDIFNGRIDSLDSGRVAVDRAMDAASAGNALAVLPGVALARFLRQAPGGTAPIAPFVRMSKGQLGEKLSVARTFIRGGRTLRANGVRLPLSQGYTVPDSWTKRPGSQYVDDIVESKFDKAKLTPAQNRAHRELANYRVDHFVPNDLGAALELPLGIGIYQMHSTDQDKPARKRK